MFITSLLTLSGVAAMFGVGSIIKNGGEILSDLNVGMRNKNVKVGKNSSSIREGVNTNGDINNLRKKIGSQH